MDTKKSYAYISILKAQMLYIIETLHSLLKSHMNPKESSITNLFLKLATCFKVTKVLLIDKLVKTAPSSGTKVS